ncbi:ATP-dependent helicase [Candidatus Dependentiae bacterium]|nr:ATP-dependent helicase [Candidatus Dependentiae bacterium]
MSGITTFIPNRFQEAIYDFISDETKGNLIIEGLAGTAKTHTIVEALNSIPRNKDVVFLAYNRHIAAELRKKAPSWIEVRTTHSMGLKAIIEFNGERKTNSRDHQYKIYTILDKVVKDRNQEYAIKRNRAEIIPDRTYRDSRSKIKHIIDHFRNNLLTVNEENLEYIMLKYDISIISLSIDAILDLIIKTLDADKKDTLHVDYGDMLYLPTTMLMPFEKYDYVFCDESQDLNESQIRMLLMLKKPDGHIIAVGDRKQSLYGFRGADTEAMEKIKLATDGISLPLNICYRCPKSHIRLANEFVPEMEPAPDAIEGNVETIGFEELEEFIKPGDLAICRNNAPLVKPALDLLRHGVKVNIRGKDIKSSLVDLIKKTGTGDIETMKEMLISHLESEVKILKEKNKNPSFIIDKVEIILEFAELVETPKELISYIYKLFSDENAEITFSTVHGAKGMEADNIFFIEPSLIPSTYARQDWELQGEANIMYVALTRSKKTLYIVEK